MDIPTALSIVVFSALIHASFQLSISVLTLLSGHAIGAKHAHAKVLRLTTGFVIGAGVMTTLLLTFLAFLLLHASPSLNQQLTWTVICGLLLGVGIAVWLFYYRRGRGTTLWVPRGMAEFLGERSKATKRSAEAFSLGLTSVIAELLFILAPLSAAAFTLTHLPTMWQIVGIGLYAVVSLFSLIIVWGLVGSGHKLSRIQKWREQYKHFLQFAAASGLVVLGFYVYVNEVLVMTAGASL